MTKIESYRDLTTYQRARVEARRVFHVSKKIGAMLQGLIDKADKFCPQPEPRR